MNYEMMIYVIMSIAKIEGLLLFVPSLVSLVYGEYKTSMQIAIIAIVFTIIGFITTIKKPRKSDLFTKDGILIVGMAWICFSIIGSLPFIITGSIPSVIDALFETVSGFTTTGSSILTNIEDLPQGVVFWRSFTHWIGGMGVLVFVMAITPLVGSSTMNIMQAEVPGPSVDKLVPKTKQTAKILYTIYIVMTLLEVVFLMFGNMSFFDSLMHAFSTAGTGGFSNKSNSVKYFDSAYIDGVITVFTIFFGINFNIFYLLLLRKFSRAFKSEELRWYLIIIIIATTMITINTYSVYGSVLKAFRYASFQVVTVISTTGFMTADFNLWPSFSQAILILLMIIGACAGSTGGGLKVSRVLIIFRYMKSEIKKIIHPRSVNNISFEGKVIDDSTLRSISAYLILYSFIILFSFLLISINNFDFQTNMSSVITCINNVGPGLGKICGPVGNFSSFSDFSKIILIFDMLIGRLEIFPIILLFSPRILKRRF
ncbi:TrkH family potassium uptake protein [Peptostreptococcus equinus]|uniref:TrkH family potassium uptake protein n=1 Tax=Peptostreptococcus equinus TaxID=3003601 RepID=A0ABY7JSL6_9FIRM|nr:TrkH family potassium uptake protein [Peptostreptococcus sp. CBA3647]WAW15158.1 TrkH family potassium uptake protein [Peptostreptococcus sp. CBA3647]